MYVTFTQLFDQAHRWLQRAPLQHKCLQVCPVTVVPTSTNSEPKSQKILSCCLRRKKFSHIRQETHLAHTESNLFWYRENHPQKLKYGMKHMSYVHSREQTNQVSFNYSFKNCQCHKKLQWNTQIVRQNVL